MAALVLSVGALFLGCWLMFVGVWLEGRRLSSPFAGVAFWGPPHKQVGPGAVTLSVGPRWVSLHSDAPPPWC